MRAGDRVAVAVSGGADSVALLRALVDLRDGLGIVISVVHFHHGIRGAAADEDLKFVSQLAQVLGLAFHEKHADVPAYAATSGKSLETAGRELRYQFFDDVLKTGEVDRVATAHTLDDQAETVLMRLLRGAGTRGLAGIYPVKDHGRYIRPLLTLRRKDVIDYLESLQQPWREDETNRDTQHARNKIRHDLLPLLQRDFNPAVVEVLARTAAIAQDEEAFWSAEVARNLRLVVLPGKPTRGGGRRQDVNTQSVGFDMAALQKLPLALQRPLLREAARDLNLELDAEHVERMLALMTEKGNSLELPDGWRAVRSLRELSLEHSPSPAKGAGLDYAVSLPIPGEVAVHEISLLVQARLEPIATVSQGYNLAQASGALIFKEDSLPAFVVRNWQEGDRIWPAHSRQEKKVKEVLQQLKVPKPERGQWPVIAAGETLVWVRGARQREILIDRQGHACKLTIESQVKR
ncbi:MAG TPA: tRNA lysidine(34) synthetase TilS [Terriglobales bacterium]|nr:tRNA lysidine(34) synthetase TilS [Terriglobales bacterium]